MLLNKSDSCQGLRPPKRALNQELAVQPLLVLLDGGFPDASKDRPCHTSPLPSNHWDTTFARYTEAYTQPEAISLQSHNDTYTYTVADGVPKVHVLET